MRMRHIISLVGVALLGSAGAADAADVALPTNTRPVINQLVTRKSAPQPGATVLAQGNFVVLQMNLCNGGDAGCYAGGYAPYEAATVIESPQYGANIVTLNEICFNDVDKVLFPAMARAWAGDWTYYVFVPAMIKGTENPYRCANGDRFGNAVMGRVPKSKWQNIKTWGWRYGNQDGGLEERTAACAYAIGDHLACATHLSARSKPVALVQCESLMFSLVPYMRSVAGATGPTVIGGDFNLHYNPSDPENVQKCVPNGYTRKGDNSVQHIIFSNDLEFKDTFIVPLQYTDHVGWGVVLNLR